MAELILLGSGAALTDGSREPTQLALVGEHSTVLVDCGANPLRQLQRAGVPLASVERLFLTHSHPDHIAGFPLLMEMLWLSGRRHPLPVHGPADALDVARRVFAQWDTRRWTGLPEIHWHEVPPEPGVEVAVGTDFRLTAAPGVHSVPVIAIRAEDLTSGGSLVYGADGEASPGVLALARGCDLLVLEATGHHPGHSTAAASAALAAEARARRLVLVHLAPSENDLETQRREAKALFSGPVHLDADLDRFVFCL